MPPSACLGEPHINEKAREFLADDMKWLASKEALLSLSMMTVSSKSDADRILTQRMSGRSTVVRHGRIEYADNVGGIVIEKGGWLSGRELTNKSISYSTPWGLYGLKDSMGDIKISNALIESGFKSALSLGYVPLNPEKTEEWLLSKFKEDTDMKGRINRSFSIVKNNGDIPVLDFRVGGVEYRIGTVLFGSKNTSFTEKAFLAHSAKLLKEEMIKFPKRYKENLSNPEKIEDYLLVLDKVGRGVVLNEDEFFLYFDIYMAIGKNNTSSLEKFLDNRKELGIGLSDDFSTYLSQSKDICYAGFTYDYEQMKTCKPSEDHLSLEEEKEALSEYSDNWKGSMKIWIHRVSKNFTENHLQNKINNWDWFSNNWESRDS
jgi:hypothetical protein